MLPRALSAPSTTVSIWSARLASVFRSGNLYLPSDAPALRFFFLLNWRHPDTRSSRFPSHTSCSFRFVSIITFFSSRSSFVFFCCCVCPCHPFVKLSHQFKDGL